MPAIASKPSTSKRTTLTLLRQAMQRLAKGGTLIFSTNFREFKLDKAR